MLPAGGANILDLDFRQWLAARRLQIVENAEHAFAGALSHRAMQLSFVKRARVDLQTSLGGRKGAGGVDVAGALRETDDDIVGWQLRAYAGEDSAKGLNSGLFYRRIVNGALAGVNVFADYEDGDDGDFWRWSVGGDVKNRFGELSANHYFAITDAQMVGAKKTYTREGYDVDVAARIPRLEWAKARVGYYNFKGEFGDEDEDGLRAGLDLSPGEGVVFGVEYDGEDGSFGGNISYTHTFGETQQDAQRAGEFNPRAHFYDAVRREYSQRISRAEGGGGLVIVGTGVSVEVKSVNTATTATMTATLTAGMMNASFPFADEVLVTSADTGAITMRGGAWHLTLSGANPAVAFLGGTVMSVANGMGSFYRSGAGMNEVVIAGVRISLLGTRFDFDSDGNITLHEGGLSMATATGLDIEVAHNATVQVGGDTVRCGGDTVSEVTANCAIGTGDGAAATVTAPAGANVNVGRYTIDASRNVSDISARISAAQAGFFTGIVGREIRVMLSAAAAAEADPSDKLATLHLTDTKNLVPMSAVVFTVRVNPQPLAVSPDGALNTLVLTTGNSITVGVLQVVNGFAAGRRVAFVGGGASSGDFRLAGGTLILGGNNAARRLTAATVVGVDNHNTESNTLAITVSIDATPPPLMPVCSGADSTCRTLTVTPQNASDQTQMGDVTVVSVNLRFVESGQTVQTREKVLMTLLDGAAFTVTDEQVRAMLGTPSGVSVTIIDNPVTVVTVAAHFTAQVQVAGALRPIVVNQGRINVPLSLGNIQTNGDIEQTLNFNVQDLASNQRQFRVVDPAGTGFNIGQSILPDAGVRDYIVTVAQDAVVNAGVDSLRGLSLIAPLGAGGTGDSALLELEFSPPQLWQVSYLPNANHPGRLSSFPRRRESPRALVG